MRGNLTEVGSAKPEAATGARAIEDLQAASAVGQGKLYRVYDELLRDRLFWPAWCGDSTTFSSALSAGMR